MYKADCEELETYSDTLTINETLIEWHDNKDLQNLTISCYWLCIVESHNDGSFNNLYLVKYG